MDIAGKLLGIILFVLCCLVVPSCGPDTTWLEETHSVDMDATGHWSGAVFVGTSDYQVSLDIVQTGSTFTYRGTIPNLIWTYDIDHGDTQPSWDLSDAELNGTGVVLKSTLRFTDDAMTATVSGNRMEIRGRATATSGDIFEGYRIITVNGVLYRQ